MAPRLEQLHISYTVYVRSFGGAIAVKYVPVVDGTEVEYFAGEFHCGGTMAADGTVTPDPNYENLRERIETLAIALSAHVTSIDVLEFELDGIAVKGKWSVDGFTVWPDAHRVEVSMYPAKGGAAVNRTLYFGELPSGIQRLTETLTTSLDRIAWEAIRESVGAPLKSGDVRDEIIAFVSYRSTHSNFAETLALRLREEGIGTWFDKFEILAGDSIPGRIEEGFERSSAFLPILTADYDTGPWATEELRTAITRRIESEYRIIPVLLENCDRPPLISHLRYVDFTHGDAESYEIGVREIVDAIFGLSPNALDASKRARG